MTRRALLLAATALLALAGLLAWAFMPAAVRVEVTAVTRGPFVLTVDDDGITRVRERYTVTAPVAGQLLRPPVVAGTPVARGQVVATLIPANPQLLDPRTRAELLARREAAQARRERALALQKQADAALAQALQDARRIDDLARQGFVPASDREKATLAADGRRREQEAAAFEADAALHELQQARAAASRLDADQATAQPAAAQWPIRAPVAGSVLRLQQESAGPVALGAPLLEIGDVSRLEAVIDVLSEDATGIRPGAPVSLAAGGTLDFSGRVNRLEPAARTRVSALGVEEQRVNVIVDLQADPALLDRLGDGYRVDARIEVARHSDAVQVPTAALFRQDGNWAVYRVVKQRALLTPVRISLRNADTAVVESGLSPGERVVAYPGDAVSDGRRLAE